MLDITGIVLAGGKSSRFGRNKSTERLLGRSLLERVVEGLAKVCDPILVVTGADSVTPELPSHYHASRVRDFEEAEGPLQGLRSGLSHSDTPYSFVASCDMPFLNDSVIERMTEWCSREEAYDAIVPVVEGKPQVLHSIYHRRMATTIERIMLTRTHTPGISSILKELEVLFLDQRDILQADEELWSFFDIDTEKDLEIAQQHLTFLRSWRL